MKENDGSISKGLTVPQAKKVTKLLSEGESVESAAEAIGISLNELRKQGRLIDVIKSLLERADLTDQARRKLGRARLVELSMQDHDLKVALGAAKVISGEGLPGVAIQFNQNLVTDPEVLESIKNLGIEVEGGKDDEKAGG